jgi:UDP-GlcNAc:undecaprenyl-phosphate GlcNAc-1-phosphate transferase
MGDAGSLLLGLSMAVLMIMFSRYGLQFWLASIVIFGLPILDTAVAFARRIVNKRPLFVSDRGHIYDQMMDRGLSVRKTVALCYWLTALYAVVGLIVGLLPILAAVAVCAAVVLVSAFAVWKKGYLKMTGLRGVNPQNSSHHSAGHRVD